MQHAFLFFFNILYTTTHKLVLWHPDKKKIQVTNFFKRNFMKFQDASMYGSKDWGIKSGTEGRRSQK